MPRKDVCISSALLVLLALTSTGCSGGASGGSGSGSNPPASGPGISLSVPSLTFTGIDSGYPTAAQTITLTNSGNATLTLNSEQLSGADSTYFGGVGGGVGGCAAISLAAGASCTTQVVFTPLAARTYSAALTFTDNASNSPQSVALTGTLSPSSMPAAQAKFAYVASDQGAIYSFNISSSGALTPTSPASVSFGDTFGAMVLDPLNKYLFVAGFLSGDVFSYSINPTTGILTAAGTANATVANNRPENIAIDPTGTFLYVANTGMGTVTEISVNRSTGALTQGATTTVPLYPNQQLSEPGGLVVDPSGKYLYVSEVGYIALYFINTSTGAITLADSPPLTQGVECFNLVLGPTGTNLYCPNDSAALSVYSLSPTTGQLASAGSLATGQGSTDVAFTSTNKFAYATNRTDGTISLYGINASTGVLTTLSSSPDIQGGEPYVIAIDPSNQLAYVLVEAGDIETLAINSDGTLSHSSYIAAPDPVGLAIYP